MTDLPIVHASSTIAPSTETNVTSNRPHSLNARLHHLETRLSYPGPVRPQNHRLHLRTNGTGRHY